MYLTCSNLYKLHDIQYHLGKITTSQCRTSSNVCCYILCNVIFYHFLKTSKSWLPSFTHNSPQMLRSSIGGTKLCQENFGLHAALPHKAFDLLNRKFRVTFECFASPFNCYFSQYCSAFPDIDCYFGSRGSFFEFRPKSGSFQANPPFSEEVMLAMAEHMISLLNGKLFTSCSNYEVFFF